METAIENVFSPMGGRDLPIAAAGPVEENAQRRK
jgi:hypothetical protein